MRIAAAYSPLALAALEALVATARDPQRYKAAHAPRGTPRRPHFAGRAARKAAARKLAMDRHRLIQSAGVAPKHLHSAARVRWVLNLPVVA